jgi:hypothetical protein
MTHEMHLLVRSEFTCTGKDPIPVKGFVNPVTPYRVVDKTPL